MNSRSGGRSRALQSVIWWRYPSKLQPNRMPDLPLRKPTEPLPSATDIAAALGPRSIVLIGMMGAGKSSIGRRLAKKLDLPFVDADAEIELAAGMPITDIFDHHGEDYFRSGEARVIARLLDQGRQVLATGGGAFMNPGTRSLIAAKGISVWLKAEPDILLRRIKRRSDRPLLRTADPEATLNKLIEQRYPVYAEADLIVHSREVPHEVIVDEIIAAAAARLGLGAAVAQSSAP